jgi:hypothetical protein
MAFIATTIYSQKGFERIMNVIAQEKGILQSWNTQLGSNITGLDAVNMAANLTRVLTEIDEISVLPGFQAYAQQQFGNANYDIASEFVAMRTALASIKNWLVTNIPANAVSIHNGVLVGLSYTPAQTTALRNLVADAITTIE